MTQSLATLTQNEVENLRAAAAETDINLVKFRKGDWFLGEEIVDSTELFAASPRQAFYQWVRFEDKAMADSIRCPYTNRNALPKREDLGYTDQDDWPKLDGVARDPWVLFVGLPLYRPKTFAETTFSTASWGGKRCVNGLVTTYGNTLDAGQAKEYAIVTLGSRTKSHPTYGPIPEPVLNVREWRNSLDLETPPQEGGGGQSEGALSNNSAT